MDIRKDLEILLDYKTKVAQLTTNQKERLGRFPTVREHYAELLEQDWCNNYNNVFEKYEQVFVDNGFYIDRYDPELTLEAILKMYLVLSHLERHNND